MKTLFISMMILLSGTKIFAYVGTVTHHAISHCMCIEIEEIEKSLGKLTLDNHIEFYNRYQRAITAKFGLDESSVAYPLVSIDLIEEGVIQDPTIIVYGHKKGHRFIREAEKAREFCKQKSQAQQSQQ